MKINQSNNNILVLGTAQDGGYPQAGCRHACCREAWKNKKLSRLIASLAIIDESQCWIIDLTPDFKSQIKILENIIKDDKIIQISGIFLTHAHIGHYLGLLELGLEVMNTSRTPVYVMSKMKSFLELNAPFLQLIKQENIILNEIEEKVPIQLNRNVSILPFKVPHRNEFSETVGYQINSLGKSIIYIPDIDSWDDWKTDINDIIIRNDIIILDGTFYDLNELKDRNINSIPHPSIQQSMKKFSKLKKIHRKKVYFTHLNHTNNTLRMQSSERMDVINKGFNIAEDGMTFKLENNK